MRNGTTNNQFSGPQGSENVETLEQKVKRYERASLEESKRLKEWHDFVVWAKQQNGGKKFYKIPIRLKDFYKFKKVSFNGFFIYLPKVDPFKSNSESTVDWSKTAFKPFVELYLNTHTKLHERAFLKWYVSFISEQTSTEFKYFYKKIEGVPIYFFGVIGKDGYYHRIMTQLKEGTYYYVDLNTGKKIEVPIQKENRKTYDQKRIEEAKRFNSRIKTENQKENEKKTTSKAMAVIIVVLAFLVALKKLKRK